jgi:hypothetical protein
MWVSRMNRTGQCYGLTVLRIFARSRRTSRTVESIMSMTASGSVSALRALIAVTASSNRRQLTASSMNLDRSPFFGPSLPR